MSLVGVGLGLTSTESGLEVTEILEDGPVDRTGKVRIGDILKKVDGNVCGNTVKSVKHLLTGPAGSSVTLTFLRHDILGMPDAVSICVKRGIPQIPTGRSSKQQSGRQDQERPSPFSSFGFSFFNFGGSDDNDRENTDSNLMTGWQQGHDWWLAGDEQSPSAEYAPDCTPYGLESPLSDEEGMQSRSQSERFLPHGIENPMHKDAVKVWTKAHDDDGDEFAAPIRQEKLDFSRDLSSHKLVENATEQELRLLRAERKQDNSRIIMLLTERDELKEKISITEAKLRQEQEKVTQVEKDMKRKTETEASLLLREVQDAYVTLVSSRQASANLDPEFAQVGSNSERLFCMVKAMIQEAQSRQEEEKRMEKDLKAAKEEIEGLSAKISLLQMQKDEDHRQMSAIREERENMRSDLAKVRKELDMSLQELLNAYQDAEKYKMQSSSAEEQSHQKAEEFESLRQSYQTMQLMYRMKDEEIQRLREELEILRSANEKSIEMSAREKHQLEDMLITSRRKEQELQYQVQQCEARADDLVASVRSKHAQISQLEERIVQLSCELQEEASKREALTRNELPAKAEGGEEASRSDPSDTWEAAQKEETEAEVKELKLRVESLQAECSNLEAIKFRLEKEHFEYRERTHRDRAKVFDEMRLAFKELKARQQRIELFKRLMSLLEKDMEDLISSRDETEEEKAMHEHRVSKTNVIRSRLSLSPDPYEKVCLMREQGEEEETAAVVADLTQGAKRQAPKGVLKSSRPGVERVEGLEPSTGGQTSTKQEDRACEKRVMFAMDESAVLEEIAEEGDACSPFEASELDTVSL
mmetsp:Transcript_50992/g.159331  ORF Transcript_50992/g.159331 Transcript_50992/m.159331 type:complete len:815 (+) Transcript_50992:266-2710(+)